MKNRGLELITFNVGGTRYTTQISTLETIKDNMLYSLVCETELPPKGEELFIDCDGVLFGHVLNCFRNGVVFSATDLGLSHQVWAAELAYYDLKITPPKQTVIPKKRPLDMVNAIKEGERKKNSTFTARLWRNYSHGCFQNTQPRVLYFRIILRK